MPGYSIRTVVCAYGNIHALCWPPRNTLINSNMAFLKSWIILFDLRTFFVLRYILLSWSLSGGDYNYNSHQLANSHSVYFLLPKHTIKYLQGHAWFRKKAKFFNNYGMFFIKQEIQLISSELTSSAWQLQKSKSELGCLICAIFKEIAHHANILSISIAWLHRVIIICHRIFGLWICVV